MAEWQRARLEHSLLEASAFCKRSASLLCKGMQRCLVPLLQGNEAQLWSENHLQKKVELYLKRVPFGACRFEAQRGERPPLYRSTHLLN